MEARSPDVPSSTFFRELGLKLFLNWSLDIEEGEETGEIQEKGPHGEVSSRTYSVIQRKSQSGAKAHRLTMEMVFLPST